MNKNWFTAVSVEVIEGLRNKIKMADKVEKVARPMKFPYTFSAKIAQFPIKHYLKNQWIWKYYAISLVICLPVFNSISKLANSPGNVAKWAEIRRREAAEHHH
ncbi:uncharacterized protein LOC126879818 isoform X1 [Diabrotica virgifera virgifera]|uniref:Uncharacterized protein n=2 Tax=Diabrotica virgifera virgifera TaxID=50390 RepID=A0ABM5JM79_DIAVI|nr:uncharacterized protein LOC126879818 isoform X1 [Diabrotica virgifera virgifera]